MVKKLIFMQPRGNPETGATIARGAVIEIAEPWASKFIADGTAVEAPEPKTATKQKTKSAKDEKQGD